MKVQVRMTVKVLMTVDVTESEIQAVRDEGFEEGTEVSVAAYQKALRLIPGEIESEGFEAWVV